MVDDPAEVRERVERALAEATDVNSSTITVDMLAGRIILRGAADTWAEREQAERIASDVRGVIAVENELVVRVPDVVHG